MTSNACVCEVPEAGEVQQGAVLSCSSSTLSARPSCVPMPFPLSKSGGNSLFFFFFLKVGRFSLKHRNLSICSVHGKYSGRLTALSALEAKKMWSDTEGLWSGG